MVHVPIPPSLVVRPLESPTRFRDRFLLVLFWLVTAGAGLVGGWVLRGLIPEGDTDSLLRSSSRVASLQQRIAVLERAEQVATTANAELQRKIGERQEEIAGLRADLAFYSRLTSTGAKRDGLAVQDLHLEPVSGNARMINFTVTLTQNLKVGQVTNGRLKLSVNGMRADQMATFAWTDLAQNEDANGLAFSFKYFQQIKGTLLLPDGFVPSGVSIEADGGAELGKTERDFSWSEASVGH